MGGREDGKEGGPLHLPEARPIHKMLHLQTAMDSLPTRRTQPHLWAYMAIIWQRCCVNCNDIIEQSHLAS